MCCATSAKLAFKFLANLLIWAKEMRQAQGMSESDANRSFDRR